MKHTHDFFADIPPRKPCRKSNMCEFMSEMSVKPTKHHKKHTISTLLRSCQILNFKKLLQNI